MKKKRIEHRWIVSCFSIAVLQDMKFSPARMNISGWKMYKDQRNLKFSKFLLLDEKSESGAAFPSRGRYWEER